MKKSLTSALFAGILLGLCSNVYAVPLTWHLEAFTFSDSAIATGSYVYDADTGIFSDWNIVTQGGISAIPGVTYDTTSSYASSYDLHMVSFIDNGWDTGNSSLLEFWLTDVMTNAGGTIDLIPFNGLEAAFWNCPGTLGPDFPFGCDYDNRAPITGFVTASTTTSVPEPTSLLLMALGLSGLGFSRRKRT